MRNLPDLACACATVRRAARLVTQLYDEELRPHVESSQFALLEMIGMRPGCNQAMIARVLGFDKTTVSRNLSLLKKKGWIEQVEGDDRRERGLHLTATGQKVRSLARPGWTRAQNRLRSGMTSDQWDAMWQGLRIMTNAVGATQAQGLRSRSRA